MFALVLAPSFCYPTPTEMPHCMSIGVEAGCSNTTAADRVTAKIASTPISFNVKKMPAESLVRLRFVGAWLVKIVVSHRRKHA